MIECIIIINSSRLERGCKKRGKIIAGSRIAKQKKI